MPKFTVSETQTVRVWAEIEAERAGIKAVEVVAHGVSCAKGCAFCFEEAFHEDAGNASVGFDGRPHFATIDEAARCAIGVEG